MKPGTPEYDQAYEKEMQRLEAEAKGGDDTSKEGDDKGKADEKDKPTPEQERIEALSKDVAGLKQQNERLEKSLRDTKTWGHRNAAKVSKLEGELAQERKARTAPEILKANPG